MHRNNLIASLLSVCLIALIPSVGTTQTTVVKSWMAALRADTEAHGAPKVKAATFTSATPRSPLTLLMLWLLTLW